MVGITLVLSAVYEQRRRPSSSTSGIMLRPCLTHESLQCTRTHALSHAVAVAVVFIFYRRFFLSEGPKRVTTGKLNHYYWEHCS